MKPLDTNSLGSGLLPVHTKHEGRVASETSRSVQQAHSTASCSCQPQLSGPPGACGCQSPTSLRRPPHGICIASESRDYHAKPVATSPLVYDTATMLAALRTVRPKVDDCPPHWIEFTTDWLPHLSEAQIRNGMDSWGTDRQRSKEFSEIMMAIAHQAADLCRPECAKGKCDPGEFEKDFPRECVYWGFAVSSIKQSGRVVPKPLPGQNEFRRIQWVRDCCRYKVTGKCICFCWP